MNENARIASELNRQQAIVYRLDSIIKLLRELLEKLDAVQEKK